MSEEINYPWLTFFVGAQNYCVSSRNIMGIRQIHGITPLPEAGSSILGVILQNDTPIPVIDLRTLLGFESLEDYSNHLIESVEGYKLAHATWADTYKQCAESGEDFPLARDPHECALGKWLDSYETSDGAIRTILNRIKPPHAAMHAFAQSFESMGESEKTNSTIEVEHLCHSEILPQMDRLLQTVRENSRQLVVVLEDGERMCAVLVDDIHSTMSFADQTDKDIFAGLQSSDFVIAVMRGDDQTIYLELSADKLLRYAASAQHVVA